MANGNFHPAREATEGKLTAIGSDLAKNVFQVHGVDEQGKTVLKKPLKREQMAAFFANLTPCLIGMEACGSAHFWANKLQAMEIDGPAVCEALCEDEQK